MSARVDETNKVFDAVPKEARVLVGVSGGKDSVVTLAAAVERLGVARVEGFLMELIPGLECEWKTIRPLIARYKIPFHTVPHWQLSHFLRDNVYRTYMPGSDAIRKLKQVDVERHLRAKTGVEWFAFGWRTSDSMTRNAYLKNVSGVDAKARRIFPVWTWKTEDILAYVRLKRLPLQKPIGGAHKKTSGVNLTPETLVWLKSEFPDDYKKVLRVFPLAGAAVFRHEYMNGKELMAARKKARHEKVYGGSKQVSEV